MSRIICITTTEILASGRRQIVVSHGIDEVTGRAVTLPCEPPQLLGAKLDQHLGEWVLDGSGHDTESATS